MSAQSCNPFLEFSVTCEVFLFAIHSPSSHHSSARVCRPSRLGQRLALGQWSGQGKVPRSHCSDRHHFDKRGRSLRTSIGGGRYSPSNGEDTKLMRQLFSQQVIPSNTSILSQKPLGTCCCSCRPTTARHFSHASTKLQLHLCYMLFWPTLSNDPSLPFTPTHETRCTRNASTPTRPSYSTTPWLIREMQKPIKPL